MEDRDMFLIKNLVKEFNSFSTLSSSQERANMFKQSMKSIITEVLKVALSECLEVHKSGEDFQPGFCLLCLIVYLEQYVGKALSQTDPSVKHDLQKHFGESPEEIIPELIQEASPQAFLKMLNPTIKALRERGEEK